MFDIRKKLLVGSLCVLSTLAVPQALASSYVDMGDVSSVKGDVQAVSKATERKLNNKSDLFEGETIVTGVASGLTATLSDDGLLQVPENSRLELTKFLLKSEKPIGELKLIRGAFRLTSGKLNKLPEGKLTISTPMATLGIRGTDFYVNQQDDALTLSLIDNGEIFVTDVNGDFFALNEPMTTIVIREGQEMEKRKFTEKELYNLTKQLDTRPNYFLAYIFAITIVGYIILSQTVFSRNEE